jgi:hypothetical protein
VGVGGLSEGEGERKGREGKVKEGVGERRGKKGKGKEGEGKGRGCLYFFKRSMFK